MTENSNREEEVEEQYAYNVDMVDAWVFSDDTFGHAPYDERDPAHTPCPPNPRNVYQLERALNGLNSLQLAHDAPISPSALDTVLEVLLQSQPYAVRAACRLLPPNGPDLWGLDEQKADLVLGELALGPENDGRNVEFFTRVAFYDRDEARDARPKRGDPQNKGKGRARPEDDEPPLYHVLWPILVADQYGEDWVTLIWTQKMRQDRDSHYAEIQEFHVVDPRLDSRIYASNFQGYRDRRDRILKRFESLLANLDATCVVTFAPGCLVEDENGSRLESYWYSPEMPMSEHTTGERCYAVVKQWMWKLTHELFPHADDDNAATQAPRAVLRFVNPYFERMAMAGICAWVAMGSVGFDARLTIESLPEGHEFRILVNEQEAVLSAQQLQGPAKEPRMGRPMRQLDQRRGEARDEQAEAESQRQHDEAESQRRHAEAQRRLVAGVAQASATLENGSREATARDTAARGDQANTAAGADGSTGDVNAAAAAAQVPTSRARKGWAPASAPGKSTAQPPDPQPPSQQPAPDRGLAGNQRLATANLGQIPTHRRSAPQGPGSAAGKYTSGSCTNPESSDGESLGPPPKMRNPQMTTPLFGLGPDNRARPQNFNNPLPAAWWATSSGQPPAPDRAVRANKRSATEAPLNFGGTVPPQDKRQRSQTPGAASVPAGDTPLQPTNPFPTPSSRGGFLTTPPKRGLSTLPSPPTRTSPREHRRHPHHHVAPGNAPAPRSQNPWLGTTIRQPKPAVRLQNPPGGNGGNAPITGRPKHLAAPAPAPEAEGLDYDRMNRVFGNLPGALGALNNEDIRC